MDGREERHIDTFVDHFISFVVVIGWASLNSADRAKRLTLAPRKSSRDEELRSHAHSCINVHSFVMSTLLGSYLQFYQSDSDSEDESKQEQPKALTPPPVGVESSATSSLPNRKRKLLPSTLPSGDVRVKEKKSKKKKRGKDESAPPKLASHHNNNMLENISPAFDFPVPNFTAVLPSTESASPLNRSTSDLPHQGRIRSFAHVEGNWATHLFIPLQIETCREYEKLVEDGIYQDSRPQNCSTASSWHHLPYSQSSSHDGSLSSSSSPSPSPSSSPSSSSTTRLHISLSRTFVLRYEQIQPFLLQLRQLIEVMMKEVPLPPSISSSSTTLSPDHHRCHRILARRTKVYENDEKTRRFLAMLVYPTGETELEAVPSNHATISSAPVAAQSLPTNFSAFSSTHSWILGLLHRLNRFLIEWGAPSYYDPPELHATLAWQLMPTETRPIKDSNVDSAQLINENASTTVPDLDRTRATLLPTCVASFTHLQCSIGNKHHLFSLINQANNSN